MCVVVATPNLDTVSQRNCRQEPDTRMTVMCRRFSCSSSNIDVERAGLHGLALQRERLLIMRGHSGVEPDLHLVVSWPKTLRESTRQGLHFPRPSRGAFAWPQS